MSRLIERIRAAAFDLDGTLVDTAPDLALAANTMLELLGYSPLERRKIEALIGEGANVFISSRDEARGSGGCAFAISASLCGAPVRSQPRVSGGDGRASVAQS